MRRTLHRTALPAMLVGTTMWLAGCTDNADGSAHRTSAGSAPAGSAAVSGGATSGASRSRTESRVAAIGAVTELATGLTTPWGLAFLPDGSALVTERDTALVKLLSPSGAVTGVGRVEGVEPAGEGGLLGIAVSPDVASTRLVLVYYTSATDNRIAALTWADGKLTGQREVLTGIPKSGVHNGGRLAFGPDGLLYVGTGDAGNRDAAQDVRALGGKILRVKADGTAAPANPFPESPLVYSLGHRNVQGLAFDDAGRLWSAEFGQDTFDELNLVNKGDNDGWPTVEGPSTDPRFVSPERSWPTDDASPSGIAIAAGSVWMAALKGQRLWQIPLTGGGEAVTGGGKAAGSAAGGSSAAATGSDTAAPIALLTGAYGRLRTAVAAPDGSLWLTTSNTDGRGDPRPRDDKILRIALR